MGTRLTNWWYRVVWRSREMMGLKPIGLYPIQWKQVQPNTIVPSTVMNDLSEEEREKIKRVQKEVQLISSLQPFFPSKIPDKSWRTLLDCETLKQRLEHIKFLKKNESEKEKDQLRKLKKKNVASLSKIVPTTVSREDTVIGDTPCFLSIPHPQFAKWERNLIAQRSVIAYRLMDRPTLVVDCRFLPHLSPRGADLTAVQLRYLVSENLQRSHPWPLHFVNWDDSQRRFSDLRQKHLALVDTNRSIGAIVNGDNYTTVFDPSKIVYLSPNAEEEMEEVEDDKVYVIGGIVDRVYEKGIPKNASLETAMKDGVKTMRLPLDKYVKWKSGTKYLTLTAVSSILYEVNMNGGEWEKTLKKYIPVRNVKGIEEKNPLTREYHERIRETDRQIIRMINKRLR